MSRVRSSSTPTTWADDQVNSRQAQTQSRPSSRASRPSTQGSCSGLPARLKSFCQCAEDASDVRSRYRLSGVTYNAKMSDEEIEGLSEYMKDELNERVMTPNVALTYDACETASVALCRWPRPSELARVIALDAFDGKGARPSRSAALPISVAYVLAKVKLSLVKGNKWGDFVGKEGANLNSITKDAGLIYAWLKGGVLYLYGYPNKTAILSAIAAIKADDADVVEVGDVEYKTMKLTNRSKDFVGQEAATTTTGGGVKRRAAKKKTAVAKTPAAAAKKKSPAKKKKSPAAAKK